MKPEALRFNFEFSRVYRRGKLAAGRLVTVHVMRRYPGVKQSGYTVNPNIIRPGFCANKRELGAVGRNRIRRLMREAYRFYEPKLPRGIDIVFTYKSKGELPSYSDILEDCGKCLGRLGVIGDR